MNILRICSPPPAGQPETSHWTHIMNHSTELKPQSFQWKFWGFLENAGEQVLVNQNLQESSPILSGPISLLDVLAWFQQYTVLDAGRAGKWYKIHPTMNHSILGFHFSLSWCQVSTASTWKERGSQSEHLSIDICVYIYICMYIIYVNDLYTYIFPRWPSKDPL